MRLGPLTILVWTSLPACASDQPAGDVVGCEGGKCDDAEGDPNPAAACIKDLSGNELSSDEVLRRGDVFARAVLGRDHCALSVADVVPRLEGAGCVATRTAFVSERSARLGKFVDYRALTTIFCDGDMVFLHYPMDAGELAKTSMHAYLETRMPAVIVTDPVTGTFNFYQSTGHDVRFFGSSLDLLKGTDIDELARIGVDRDFDHAFGVQRSCAACHTGGGLVMKELQTPWVHWEGDDGFSSPHTEELVSQAPDLLGFRSDGEAVEVEVFDANVAVNEKRIEAILAGLGAEFSVSDLLRPLFCTVDFNIASHAAEEVRHFRFAGPIVDGVFGAPRFEVPPELYRDVLKERGSRIATDPAFLETLGGLTFVVPSSMDQVYVDELRRRGMLDLELIHDTELVDFTRQIYSNDRCSLLEFTKDIDPGVVRMGSEALTSALIKELEGQKDTLSPPARDWLALLREKNTTPETFNGAFKEACTVRAREDVEGLLRDYVEYVAQVRKRAADPAAGKAQHDHTFMQFKFPGVAGFTMPVDDQPRIEGFRFDPHTCEATTVYSSIMPGT